MKYFRYLIAVMIVAASACTQLILKPGDFAWPIENVLKVDDKGFVEEKRYSFNLNVKQLFFAEFADSTLFKGKEIRIIRDKAGFYFMTASAFKNVYVLSAADGGMKLETKIELAGAVLSSPVFNQKSPNIELIDGAKKYLLNNKGIVR